MEKKFDSELQRRITSFDDNYKEILENIQKAKIQANRQNDEILLLGATKTVPVEVINYAIEKGLKAIGENKVQELNSKIDNLNNHFITTHLIGHLQTNKVKQVVDKVNMIESVDSVKLAKEINTQCKKLSIIMPILLEVNVGLEESKSGFNINDIKEAVIEISSFKNVKVSGLMTIPPICDTVTLQNHFKAMKQKFDQIKQDNLNNVHFKYLSMGMSDDYYLAILNGANIVRVGSKLFGLRNY